MRRAWSRGARRRARAGPPLSAPVSLAVSIITSTFGPLAQAQAHFGAAGPASMRSSSTGPALLRPNAVSASGERHVCHLPMSGRELLQVPAAWSCWLIRRPGGRSPGC
jgi:hypothetical protein